LNAALLLLLLRASFACTLLLGACTLLVGVGGVAGCARTAYPEALLRSQQACAQLYVDCGEAAQAGTPCVRIPRCPMQATVTTSFQGRWRDLGIGWPLVTTPRGAAD
jgi:hypothetical protein